MSLAGAAGPLHRVPVLTALAAADQRRTRPTLASPMPIQHPVPSALPFSSASSSSSTASMPAPVPLAHLPQLQSERTPSPPDVSSPSPMRAGLRAHAPIPHHIRNLPQLQPHPQPQMQMQTPLFQPAFEEADFSQVAVSMSDAAPVSPPSLSVLRTAASTSSTRAGMFDFSPHAGAVGSSGSAISTPTSVRFHGRSEDAAANETLSHSFGSPAPPMPQQHGRGSNVVRSLLDSSVSLSSLSPPQLASLDVDTLQWIQGALAARVAAAQMNDAHSWEMAQTQQPMPQSYQDQQQQLAALTLQQQQLELQQTLLAEEQQAHMSALLAAGDGAAAGADDSLMSDSSHTEVTASRPWDQSLAQRFGAAAHAAMQLPPSP